MCARLVTSCSYGAIIKVKYNQLFGSIVVHSGPFNSLNLLKIMFSRQFHVLLALSFLFSAASVYSAASLPTDDNTHVAAINADFLSALKAFIAQYDTGLESDQGNNLKFQSEIIPKESSIRIAESSTACYGDGYCCCEGCPPGSCPTVHISNTTGAVQTQAGSDTVARSCWTATSCCCTGCPPNTCGSLPAEVAQIQNHATPDRATTTTSTPVPASTSVATSPEPTSLLDCCLSGVCPSNICNNLVRTPTSDLQELLFCCLSNRSCPPNVCGSLNAVAETTIHQKLSRQEVPATSPSPLPVANPGNTGAVTFECCRTNTCATNICFGLPPLDDVQKVLQNDLIATARPSIAPQTAKGEL